MCALAPTRERALMIRLRTRGMPAKAVAVASVSAMLVTQSVMPGNASAAHPVSCNAHMSDYHPSHNEQSRISSRPGTMRT